jgi:hypothetical protein
MTMKGRKRMRLFTCVLGAAILALSPSPALAQAAGEASAVIAPKCDHACLIAAVEAHMKALAARASACSPSPTATSAPSN